MIDAGRLPTFSKLVDTGISGLIVPAGLAAPAFWATVTTGVAPGQHGILHAMEERPDGGGIGPVTAHSWRSPPLWAILASRGVPTILIGGPGSAPATAWPGCAVVDERFPVAPAGYGGDWPLPPDCVAPTSQRPALRPVRLHPAELTDTDRAGLPAKPLAETVGLHAAATHLASRVPWQLLTVYHGLLGAARTDTAYVFVDAMLANLLALAGPDTDLIVVSPEGVLIAAGPGFAADGIVHGASPADVNATMLARFNLWQAGSTGRILGGGRHGALEPVQAAARAARTRPASLSSPGLAAAAAIAVVQRDSAMQLAIVAVSAQDFAAAAELLRGILQQLPGDISALLLLGQCAVFLGSWSEADAIGRQLVTLGPELPWGHLLCGAALALAGDVAGAAPLLDRAERLGGEDPLARVRLGAVALQCGLLDVARLHYAAALRSDDTSADAQAGLGLTAAASGDAAEAKRRLRLAIGLRFFAPSLHHQLGAILASERRWLEAAASLHVATSQQPGLAEAAELLSRVERAGRDRHPPNAGSSVVLPGEV